MRNIELSILIKTFMRPQCLNNLLNSIKLYQEYWDLIFDNIIIVDDSDNKNKNLNKKIIENYNSLNILYKEFDFNSLGISKGRNVGLSYIKTPYFLLCDDDFILDYNCSLINNLNLLKEKKLDILGGVYRDICKIDDTSYLENNWLGFIKEGREFDICNIYDNLFPEFIECDICQNFFIAKTDSVLSVKFPEDMAVLEHNIFFLRAKQKKLNIASTSRLYTRHLHINNKKYSKHRNRKIYDPTNKKVIGTYISKNCIYKFNNYLDIAKEKFVHINKNNNFKRIFSIENQYNDRIKRKCVTLLGIKLKFKTPYSIKKILSLYKLKQYKKNYPQVMSTTETLNMIIDDHKSIARLGDGELKLIMGYGLGEKDSLNEYQVYNKELADKLKYILKNPHDNCLVCIDPFKDKYNDIQFYKNDLSYWENFWLESFEKLNSFYNHNYKYGITTFSRNTGFIENSLFKFKQIWNNRKVIFVVGENSHWVDEPRLFDNIRTSKYIITKGKSSYDDYKNIISAIRKYDTNYLILLAIGPTSTVLSYELSKEGYQALDIGHMPNCYLQAIGERKSPEIEHFYNKQYDSNKIV